MIETYQRNFIEFLIENGALRFGEFTLKSGRKSPYFINTGQFSSGPALVNLSKYYGLAMKAHDLEETTIIFGPAYKGIPLAVSIAYYFAIADQTTCHYLFDRKEAKTHGEHSASSDLQKVLVGKYPADGDSVVIVDDVMTTGGTKYEAVDLLKKLGTTFTIKGLVISVDRMEIDLEGNDPVATFEATTGIPVISIITIDSIISYLKENSEKYNEFLPAIEAYRKQYGVTR